MTSDPLQNDANVVGDAEAIQQLEPDPEPEPEPVAVSPVEAPVAGKKRPRIDLTTDSRERKRGKSIFGILVGTLNKAKKEDNDRNASDAAKKRADIDRRLQAQLAEENDNVRRTEELKRDRQTSNRKEEELKLRETIYHCRRTRLPALANFLLTSDTIPSGEWDLSTPLPASVNPLAAPPRIHPPPLIYLPAILTPAQSAFVEKRKTEVKEAVDKEWQDWLTQRKEGYDEVDKLRARVEEEEKRRDDNKSQETAKQPPNDGSVPMNTDAEDLRKEDNDGDVPAVNGDTGADKGRSSAPPEKEKEKEKDPGKDGEVATVADGDDAVEY